MSLVTITVDEAINTVFSKEKEVHSVKDYLIVLAEIQRNLQDKGHDPRYDSLMLLSEDCDEYYHIGEQDVKLSGVFPRVVAVQFKHQKTTPTLIHTLLRDKDTLIVADSEEFAKSWQKALEDINYSVKFI